VSRRVPIGLALAALVLAPAALAGGSPVLGAPGATGPFGAGWGTARPTRIVADTDPRLIITKIRWSTWGGGVALGVGRNALFGAQGGYSGQVVTIHLRAFDLGRCTKAGPLTYRRLLGREPPRPGAPDGRWLAVAGAATLC
jgi:hypothetical protein